MKAITRLSALAVAAALAASCTMKDQEAPPITGPSEFGTSVTISATPDVLQQDGASQSAVSITVRDSNGQPLAGVPLRAEIRVNGQAVDFGSLSARSIVSGPDGRATLVYTAPKVSANVESLVDIAVTPVGSNFQNATIRTTSIRLVPTGVVSPPSGLNPLFTATPSSATQGQSVLFDATTSTSPANNPIVQYRWDFDDGSSGSGSTTTHAYDQPGTYFPRLTITDAQGRAAATTRSVTVTAGAVPTATFTFGPTPVLRNAPVHFNASQSAAAPGRTIVSYRWEYGDGSPQESGVQVAHAYSAAGIYVVTLVVTDDLGVSKATSTPVTVQ